MLYVDREAPDQAVHLQSDQDLCCRLSKSVVAIDYTILTQNIEHRGVQLILVYSWAGPASRPP